MFDLYDHQAAMADFWVNQPKMLNTSDPGTGKTRGTIEGYHRFKEKGRMLVIAPLSILKPSWGDDIEQFFGKHYSYAVAHGSAAKRKEAFDTGADIVLINHDGVKWIAKNKSVLKGFTHLVIDEFTAFKNRTSQRSKAVKLCAAQMDAVCLLSGTPNPNTVLDLWNPTLLLDGGERLGRNFTKFRSQVCQAVQTGPSPEMVQWVDREDAQDIVSAQLIDINFRVKFEDCIDIPEHSIHTKFVELPKSLMKKYLDFEKEAVLFTEGGMINAVHAGAKAKKALQLLSGAVYDGEGNVISVHNERYELVIDLIKNRGFCVVAFNWTHERDALQVLAAAEGIEIGIIDGSVSMKRREEVVNKFQHGEIQAILAHPQSAGHGLTLTRGTTTIWTSPTYNAEHYQQFNRRIYRAGQTRKTETIRIAAKDTREIEVYNKLDSKVFRMDDLLQIFANSTEAA